MFVLDALGTTSRIRRASSVDTDYILLRTVDLGAHHSPTGRARLPNPTQASNLLIAKYPDDHGHYLLYLDENGVELTDTVHDSLTDALAQAEWEFDVKAEEWSVVGQTTSDELRSDSLGWGHSSRRKHTMTRSSLAQRLTACR